MACSPAQRAANLANSKRSTGPRTATGREAVRKNALKHGLTGAGIVVPDEDVLVIQGRFEAFEAELNPGGIVPEFLVRHLALMSVRMERCARQEAAHLTRNMLLAEQVEADAHRDELQAVVDDISQNPEVSCRILQRSPRGITWMISEWEDLKDDLNHPQSYRWNPARIARAENLVGHRYASSHPSRIGVLSNAYLGNLTGLNADDWPDLPIAERQQAAREELGRIIEAEIARLKVVLESIDRDKLARIEAGAMARALFDDSKGPDLARKYASAAERGFYKALNTILELNASTISDNAIDDRVINVEEENSSVDLALNGTELPSPSGSKARRPPAPADRRKSKARRGRRSPQTPLERPLE